jgi:SAM-dependent methyltransferase
MEGYASSEFPLMESMGLRVDSGKGRSVAGIGCGYGGMLLMMKERGFSVAGCDISMRALTFCREKGIDVACGKFPGIPFEPSSFDMVVSTHVIEHMSDPRGFIAELSTLVKPGGHLVIVTEDAFASQEWWERFRARIHGRLPGFRTSTDHTFIFGPGQLERICHTPLLENVRVKAFSRPAVRESLHWRAYKQIFRTSDRIRGHGEYLMAVARRRA